MTGFNAEKLIDIVDHFLEPFGLYSEYDSDFGYDTEDDTIYFSVLVSDRSDRLFKSYIENTFDFTVPNIFVMSLLHEVGHYFTIESFSKTKIKNAHHAKELIEKELETLALNDPHYDIVYSSYFDLSIEKVATAWAVDYYKENKTRCDRFYSSFEKEMHKQFEEMRVEV